MIRRSPGSTRSDTLFPYTTLCRSARACAPVSSIPSEPCSGGYPLRRRIDMAKLLPPDPANMSEHQRRVYDAIMSGPRGRVRGPLAVWLHRPGLAEPAQALGQYCRKEEHTSALKQLMRISNAVFGLKKKNNAKQNDEEKP